MQQLADQVIVLRLLAKEAMNHVWNLEDVIQTLSPTVMLAIGSSSVKPPFISFLGSLPSKVSCFCKSSTYSA